MNPLKGIKRMFSMNAVVELVKAVGKFVLIAGVSVLMLSTLKEQLLNMGFADVQTSIGDTVETVAWAVMLISCSMIVISLIDIP